MADSARCKRKQSNREGCRPPPRTRSRNAPQWTPQESLILVNEITAVESDCLKALSSYQKWKIIVQNCSLLDVNRTQNQCRSEWNSLLADYNQIKLWDSNKSTSYWLLDAHHRTQSRLPLHFDYDLFRKIDDYVRAHKDHSDSDDPDTDPEADADLLDVIAKLGPKRHKRRTTPLKTLPEEKAVDCFTGEQSNELDEQPEQTENPQIPCEQQTTPKDEEQEPHVEDKSQEPCPVPVPVDTEEDPKKPKIVHKRKKKVASIQDNDQITVNELDENAELNELDENAELNCAVVRENVELDCNAAQGNLHSDLTPPTSIEGQTPKPKRGRTPKRKITNAEDQMVEKLRGNAELILAVVQGKLPKTKGCKKSDSKGKDGQTVVARHQADKLIACLGDIVSILDQCPQLVQECE